MGLPGVARVTLFLLLAAAVAAAPDTRAPEPPLPDAPVAAPAAATEGVTVYPQAFFAAGNPSNALDMVQRLPGFSFQAGDAVRGFAGAAGNVLIDGQRPTSKATSLDDVLRRIPAEQVVRIELIRGGAPGIDMQGRAVLANVIRTTAAAVDATVIVQAKSFGDGRVKPRGELAWSRRRGRLAVSVGLLATSEYDVSSGDGTQTRVNPAGRIVESGPLGIDFKISTYQATFEAVRTGALDTLRLNSAVSRQGQGYYEKVALLDAAGRPLTIDRSLFDYHADKIEFGGDYERALGAGLTGRILALQTLTSDERDGLSDQRGALALVGETGKVGESIVRATLTKVRSPTLTFEGGGEAAFNFLDAGSTRVANGAPVFLPNANVRVEERRAEGFVKASWLPSARFQATFEPRMEVSRISQTGDTNAARTFKFAKPRLQTTWSPSPGRQFRTRFEREVGQLNFRDFAASSALDAGTVNVGNAELEPERAWVAEAAFEQRFWGRGSVVLTYTHGWIQQVVDLIPVAGAFDAPGNIGSGTRDWLGLTLAAPLDRLGIRGGLVRGAAVWRWSKVTDPVTGAERRISGQHAFDADFHFTQDLPRGAPPGASTSSPAGRRPSTGSTRCART
jgi:hypothetical protein